MASCSTWRLRGLAALKFEHPEVVWLGCYEVEDKMLLEGVFTVQGPFGLRKGSQIDEDGPTAAQEITKGTWPCP